MRAFAAGERRGFEVLFERHRRAVHAFLLHQTSSPALAEDLFQEVFLRVVRARESFRHGDDVRAWLFTIARNVTIDERRRRGRIRPDQPLDEATTSARPESADPHRRAESREFGAQVVAALRDLPAEQREVFLLRERGGLPFETIAHMTQTKLHTVKSRMRYALSGLRERLAAEAPAPLETDS